MPTGVTKGMDKQQALSILGLSPAASLREAKAAYRGLAKQHHPDHFSGDAAAQARAESRMKDINLAYRFLALLLASAGRKAAEPGTSKRAEAGPLRSGNRNSKAPGGLAGFLKRLRKRFRDGTVKTRPSTASRPGQKARVRRSPPAPPASGGAGRSPGFAQILDPLVPGRMKTAGAGRTKQQKKRVQGHAKPYANYVRYMDLKKQVKARKRTGESMAVGRVEKISRIRPVDRLGDE